MIPVNIRKYEHMNHTQERGSISDFVAGEGEAVRWRGERRWGGGRAAGEASRRPCPDPTLGTHKIYDIADLAGEREREKLKLSPNPPCGPLSDWSRPLSDFKWLWASTKPIVTLLVHTQFKKTVNRAGIGVWGKDFHRSLWRGAVLLQNYHQTLDRCLSNYERYFIPSLVAKRTKTVAECL